MSSVLVDAGPVVAAINRRDANHAWSLAEMGRLRGPGTTCEPVLTEAAFLVKRDGGDPLRVIDWVRNGALVVQPVLPGHVERVATLMRAYADTPMSLADACLVVLAEQRPEARVFTLDRDFLLYRAHGRQRISLLAPFAA